MDKGIRLYCNRQFLAQLPGRVNTREGNTTFRKGIIAGCMEEYGITLASAATHYNHAFINAKELALTDETVAAQLVGLGRADDKKGGRKPKAKPATAPSVIPQPASALLQNFINAGAVQGAKTGDAPDAEADAAEEAPEGDAQQETAPEAPVEPEAPVVKYSVRKVADGTIVCEDLTLEEANALVAKAVAAKKSKLELVA